MFSWLGCYVRVKIEMETENDVVIVLGALCPIVLLDGPILITVISRLMSRSRRATNGVEVMIGLTNQQNCCSFF